MPRDPGRTFRVSYDLDLESHKASLLLNSTDQKVSWNVITDSRGGDSTRA